MFKIDGYFSSHDIFNDLLRKRFNENFDSDHSRLWITPGHIVFTTELKVHTCDARPHDLATSPNETQTDELLISSAPVLDVFFDTESSSTRMYIVFTNGDVQIFEYRTQLHEWARIGYFNINIVSPNSNHQHIVLNEAMISFHQNMMYWSQKSTGFDLYRREVPMSRVREITQSAIGPLQKLMKNCPELKIIEIRDNICIIPKLPNGINLYVILSARSHVWLFHIDGKLLWRGIVGDVPVDFITLCTKTVGIWYPSGTLKVCKLLDSVKSFGYLLHSKTLLCIRFNGEIHSKTLLNIDADQVEECFVMSKLMFLFENRYKSLYIYQISDGQQMQLFDLAEFSPITNIWFHSSSIPQIGFNSNKKIYRINYKTMSMLFSSDVPCDAQALSLPQNENFHLFCLLRDVVYHKFMECDVPPMQKIPQTLQSEALLLALYHSCRENGMKVKDFPVQKMSVILSENNIVLSETKLIELLNPVVEFYKKLEKSRKCEFVE